MYKDYVDRIREKYLWLQDSKELSFRLNQPKRAGLRDECADEYSRRYKPKDENILRVFFRHTGDIQMLGRTIEGFDIEKFTPLIRFLKGEIKDTDPKNIELLAWLLNFEKRPYDDREDYAAAKYNNPVRQITSEDDDPEPAVTESSRKKRRALIIFLLLLIPIVGLIAYKWKPDKSCMYWTGDHYDPCPCIPKGGDTAVVPLDPYRLRNFRRITDNSLITPNSIGKVWYRINDGEFEFYTSKGNHPIDVTIDVRRLTDSSYAKFLKRQSP